MSRALSILDWTLRLTGIVGIISFADNLETWSKLFAALGVWLASIDWLSLPILAFERAVRIYGWVANLLFGWIEEKMLRDSAMLALNLAGITFVQQVIRRRRPWRPITFYMGALTICYVVARYPYDLRNDCVPEFLLLIMILSPLLMLTTAQIVHRVYTTPSLLKPGASAIRIHEKLFWGVVPYVAMSSWALVVGADVLGAARLSCG